jgi:hypothetical protein
MVSTGSIAVSILQSSGAGGGITYTAALGTAGSGGATYSAGTANQALAKAEASEARQLEQISRQSDVKRDLARFERVAKAAKSVDDVLKDPVARRVFMEAHGLGAQADAVGLARRVLSSNLSDPASVANRMGSINAAWLEMARTYNFPVLGVSQLNSNAAIKTISENYVAEKRLDLLDQQLPGLGSAVLFRKSAPTLDTALKILGSALGREVVTTALGLPRELSVQSLEAQQKAILARIDPAKLKEPAYADKLAVRYLIQLNGGGSSAGVVA